MRFTMLAAALILPAMASAVGLDDDTPPKPTPTTTECEAGQIYDTKTAKCVDKSSTLIDDDTRYDAVRELAYAGLYQRATKVLDVMDPTDARVLTYRGFIARKTGNPLIANRYYSAAIARNADNLLARSYMGQGQVEAGDRTGARKQLAEIRARGGRGSWPEIALKRALSRGSGFSY